MDTAMKGMAVVILMLILLLFASAAGWAEDDNFSLRHIRQQIAELDSRLLPIQDMPRSVDLPAYGPGTYERFIEVDSRKRRYEIHVPPGYSKEKQWPAVINYHGGGGRAAAARIQSGMDATADREGFIVIYPDGTGFFDKRLLTWNAGDCCSYAVNNKIDDINFTRMLLDDAVKLFNIDQRKIYATGMSNGAFMAYRVACELSERFAAISAVAGVMTVHDCRPKRPVPIIHFHGTLDKCSPYYGGVGEKSFSKVPYRSVAQNIKEWLQMNNVPDTPVKVEKKNEATITTYANDQGCEMVLVALEGMGHNWPGGTAMVAKSFEGNMSRGINASDMMWIFFQRHTLQPPASPMTDKGKR